MTTIIDAMTATFPLSLYGAQAVTYWAAATIAHEEGHAALTRCYALSAVLHGLLCLGHLAH